MIRSRLGLKALGLCALVLGLMAVWTGAAQAEETGGIWTYETGGVLKTFEGALNEPTVGGQLEPGIKAVLHTKIVGATVLYECEEVKVIEGKLKGTTGEVLGKLRFHKCVTILNGVASKNCEPKSEGSAGLINTNKIVALMLLHLLGGVKDKVMVAHPDEVGQPFATITSTEACAIGEKVPIIGLWAFIDCKNLGSTHLVKHLIEEFPALNKLFAISETVEHKASILGSAEAFLTGTHEGFKWAGLWN